MLDFRLVAALLAISAGIAAARWASADDDCGASGWPVPNPPAGATLLQVLAIIRHGDRTPWTGQSCWPNDTAVWKCDLSPADIPMFSDSQYGSIVPRVYRQIFKFGGEALTGNCSVGQLTTIGFKQQMTNGMMLKKAYIDSGFLSRQINKSEIYIRSDATSRTLQSAEALMLAMYPPNGSYTETVELHTMDRTYDDMTANPTLCPKFDEYSQEFQTSDTMKEHFNTTTKPLLDKISAAINFTVDQQGLDHFCDCLRTHKCHGLQWPKGMTEDLYEQSWMELAWQFYNSFKYPSIQENAQVGIGFLLNDIWKPMNATVDGNFGVAKFLLFSGHDTTVLPLLVALQVDNGVWPSYASMILIELYKTTTSTSGFSVRVVYNGKVLSLPFCAGSSLCDYKTFSAYLSTVTPSDPAKQCLVTANKGWRWH